jgi:hypothetical protein
MIFQSLCLWVTYCFHQIRLGPVDMREQEGEPKINNMTLYAKG